MLCQIRIIRCFTQITAGTNPARVFWGSALGRILYNFMQTETNSLQIFMVSFIFCIYCGLIFPYSSPNFSLSIIADSDVIWIKLKGSWSTMWIRIIILSMFFLSLKRLKKVFRQSFILISYPIWFPPSYFLNDDMLPCDDNICSLLNFGTSFLQ